MRTLIALLMVCRLAADAEIIDRIVASAADRVVTLGEVRRLIRIAAFVENRPPDFSPASLRHATELLVDQALIRREAELSRYSPLVPREIDEAADAFAAERKMSREELLQGLARYGFSEDDFREFIRWQLTLSRFIDYRFRPGVQVADEEVAAYYTESFAPEFESRSPGQKPPPIEEVRERIIEILTVRKATALSESWLEQARKQARVRFYGGDGQ